jgi:hypothetical protein
MKYAYFILLFLVSLASLADNQKSFKIICAVRTLWCGQGRQMKRDSSGPINDGSGRFQGNLPRGAPL